MMMIVKMIIIFDADHDDHVFGDEHDDDMLVSRLSYSSYCPHC